jgi:hypothetical protein
MAGLRARHPDEPLERLRRRLLGLVLGEAVALAGMRYTVRSRSDE